MAATPPPPGRIHTPPTPLHGPKYDSYEPYSPRRSSRLAAQHSNQALQSPQQHRNVRVSTPRSSRTVGTTRQTHPNISPPSSPASPSAGSLRLPKSRKAASSASRQPGIVFDNCVADLVKAQLKPSATETFGMLPTPAKTPRKRSSPNQAALKSTARVLFPSRPATIDDAMPSPRKHKQPAAGQNSFSISALADEGDDEASSSKIEIYTDSKERVPSMDEDENNPFLSRNAASKKKVIEVAQTTRRRVKSKSEKDKQMEEATQQDEGMIYVFRGRKMFRKYDDSPTADDDNFSDVEMKRRIGAAAERPFTRSSVNPKRLLFPSENQLRERQQEADEADEEAVTDIDVPHPKASTAAEAEQVSTPKKHRFAQRPSTPPLTTRAKRAASSKKSAPNPLDVPEQAKPPSEPEKPPTKKKPSPFDAWSRTKAGTRNVSKGVKREHEGESMDVDANTQAHTAKRTRSGAYTTS